MASLVVLEAWPWPRGSSRTLHEGLRLGLGLGISGLGLGLCLERKVLALALKNFHVLGLVLGLEKKVLALALAS